MHLRASGLPGGNETSVEKWSLIRVAALGGYQNSVMVDGLSQPPSGPVGN
jgi:hypothetical protein